VGQKLTRARFFQFVVIFMSGGIGKKVAEGRHFLSCHEVWVGGLAFQIRADYGPSELGQSCGRVRVVGKLGFLAFFRFFFIAQSVYRSFFDFFTYFADIMKLQNIIRIKQNL
jgi:hypothetical protein